MSNAICIESGAILEVQCDMEIVNFPEHQNNQVGARGTCPFCGAASYFHPHATFIDSSGLVATCASAAKCQSCKNFVLVVGARNKQNGHSPFQLHGVYPTGKPNDSVEQSVPPLIAADFSEALRCQWIKSFKACVVMCRRAIQSSALDLKAKGTRLIDQIDDLSATGRITQALQEFAHEVRLTGNDGAHPDKDGLAGVHEKDANDIVEFTREYLHHVYVMPAKLKARKPSTPPSTAAPSAPTV
jgi:hypothetical protein